MFIFARYRKLVDKFPSCWKDATTLITVNWYKQGAGGLPGHCNVGSHSALLCPQMLSLRSVWVCHAASYMCLCHLIVLRSGKVLWKIKCCTNVVRVLQRALWPVSAPAGAGAWCSDWVISWYHLISPVHPHYSSPVPTITAQIASDVINTEHVSRTPKQTPGNHSAGLSLWLFQIKWGNRVVMAATASTASSRRNSTAGASVAGGSRRGSVDSDTGFPFRLKKSKPVSQVKLVFMGKSMVRAER